MTEDLQPAAPEDAQPAAAPEDAQPAAAEQQPPQHRAPGAGEASRLRMKLTGAGVAAVVILCLVGLMAYQTFTTRLDSARKVDAATALIEDADVIVVQVDTVVRSEVTSTLAEPARIAASQVPDATNQLKRAIELLEDSRAGNTLDDEKRGKGLLAAAEARLKMMEQAPTILRLNMAASDALLPARQGWDGLVAADGKSDRAVAAYNRLNKAGVLESRRLNREVASELAAARKQLEVAERLFPEAPFDAYLAYVDLRISLNRLSQQSDAAWLKGDLKKANSIIATYNTQDASAIARAKALPETPEKAIAEAYEAAARAATDAYYKARDSATDADKSLR